MVRNGARGARRVKPLLTHFILLGVALLMIVPFYWMLSTSLKFDQDVFKMPPDLLPRPLNLGNFTQVFELMPMGRAFWNSAKIAVLGTLGTLLTSSLAAYAFAKVKFAFKGPLFILFLSTIMIPGQVTLIPLYILFSRIGWIDTHYPLIVPAVLLNAYGVFLIKQFMEGVPDSYLESAKIDGATHLQVYWRIMLPLCKPALITLGLFSFIGHWNNFLGPLIFLSTDTQFTVPLVINSFRTVYYVQWGLLMAAATVAILPVVALYLLAQRHFVEGIALSGLKG